MTHGNSEPAKKIALAALQQNTVTLAQKGSAPLRYLLAGSRQYKSLWARDFAFSSLGAIHHGYEDAIRNSLETFFQFQRPDGLLPRGIDRYSVYRRVLMGLVGWKLKWNEPFSAWYVTENGSVCLDSNLLLTWTAEQYILHTGDLDSARKWFPLAQKAILFVQNVAVEDGLITRQEPFSDWADSIARKGRVAITNIFYILSLRSLANWAQALGELQMASEYRRQEIYSTQKFQECFWNSQRGLIQNMVGDAHANITADANLFAVAFKILPDPDCLRILQELKKTPLWDPIPGRPTWPEYPSQLKSKFVKLADLADYHDRLYWLWITALAAYAEVTHGNQESFKRIILGIADQLTADGSVHEIYDLNNGKLGPLSRMLYRAENPFSWTAGMFLWALGAGAHVEPTVKVAS